MSKKRELVIGEGNRGRREKVGVGSGAEVVTWVR